MYVSERYLRCLLPIKMKDNKYSKSFEIALSAISCAVAVGFLSLGLVGAGGNLLGVWYLIAILALMLPLSKQFFLGGFLAYVGTCILALILGAAIQFWNLVPFIMFFGLHPLVNCLQIRYKINRWLALAVKAVWFDCTLLVGYFLVFGGVLGGAFLPENLIEMVNKYIYVFVFTLGSVICFVYDYMIFKCQTMVNVFVLRIKK